MSYVKGYRCTICHQEFQEDEVTYTCPDCGDVGILDVLYDYKKIKEVLSKESLTKDEDMSIWRYKALLPVESTCLGQTLRVGGTPLYTSIRLKNELGLNHLYIKDDGLNPTASLKDRASVIAVVKALEKGIDTIACSSTGNAASSLAGNAAHVGLKTVIFVPERAPIGKLTQLLIYGARVVSVQGDYGETFKLSKEAIDEYGWYNRNAAINPLLVEGKKTVVLEIMEQLNFEVPDWIVVSVGDGCTIGGIYKGLYDLLSLGFIKKMPKILGVQAQGCAPIYKAFVNNTPVEPTEENTIADSISVGIPRNPIKALDAVTLTHGMYLTVTDDEILEAMVLLGKMEGIFGEPAGVTSVAGIKKAMAEGYISEEDTVVSIVTGNGLKDVANGIKAAPEPMKIKPDISLFKKYYES